MIDGSQKTSHRYFQLVLVVVFSGMALGGAMTCVAANDVADDHKEGRKFVLVIGGTQCPAQLNQADDEPSVHSAVELANTLRIYNGLAMSSAGEVVLLTNSKQASAMRPTARNVDRAVEKMLSKVEPNDELWLFYSGAIVASADRPAFVGGYTFKDGRLSLTNQYLVSLDELFQKLKSSRAKRVVISLDRSSLAQPDALPQEVKPNCQLVEWCEEQVRRESRPRVVFLLGDGRGTPGQLGPMGKMSQFGFWLNQGLKGAAYFDVHGSITLTNLVDFVNRSVEMSDKGTGKLVGGTGHGGRGRPDGELPIQQARMISFESFPNLELALAPTTFKQSTQVLAELVDAHLQVHTTESQESYLAIKEFQPWNDEDDQFASQRRGLQGAWFARIASDRLHQTLESKLTNKQNYIGPREYASQQQAYEGLGAYAASSDPGQRLVLKSVVDYETENQRIHIHSRLYRVGEPEPLSEFDSYVNSDAELQTLLASDQAIVPVSFEEAIDNQTEDRLANSSEEPRVLQNEMLQEQFQGRIEIGVQRMSAQERGFVDAETRSDSSRQLRTFSVSLGEVYRFRFENKTDRKLALVPMIDGKTVLGKRVGLTPEQCIHEGHYFVVAPRATQYLSNWYTRKTQAEDRRSGEFELQAFEIQHRPTATGEQESLADPLPEIRFAIYETKSVHLGNLAGGPRGAQLGFGEGAAFRAEKEQETQVVADLDQPVEIQVFRYVSEGD